MSIGYNSMLDAKRVQEYSKGNVSHPEGEKMHHIIVQMITSFDLAEAEKLIATDEIPDTPPAKPIVSTEVVAEALPTKTSTENLELPS